MIKRTLYFGNPAYLSLRDAQLVVKLPEVETNDTLPESFKRNAERTIPVEDIGVLVLDNQRITITHGLVAALLENNCAVITCDNKRLPTGLLLPLSGNTVQSERFRDQIEASLPLKKQLWQQTVKAKIHNQMATLRQFTQAEWRGMIRWENDVKSGDTDNLEARAAAYYWKNIFCEYGITDFVRHREGEYPNALLNYGYAILRAIVARALVSSGMLPTFGIHHHNRYNAYCLADDIMEPYRPYVDATVLQLVAENAGQNELDNETKSTLLGIPTQDVVIDGKRSPLMVAVSQTTASLYRCYSGEQRRIAYPEIPTD